MNDAEREALTQETGLQVLTALFGLIRAMAFYETNNTAIQRLVERLSDLLEAFDHRGGEGMRMTLLAEEFFVNQELLRVDAQNYDRAKQLTADLAPFNVGVIHFHEGCRAEHLEPFVSDLQETFRTGKSALKQDGYDNLSVGKSAGQSVASFRFQPDRLAIWLYGSVLDVAERLYDHDMSVRAPSLLPIRRAMQLVIDNMRTHAAYYQILAAVADPTKPLSKSRVRVAAAIDSIGFATFLGLPKRDRMVLALAALLGGLDDTADPAGAVKTLMRFPGLGDSAMSLALAVHDARAVRQGRASGLPGDILATVESYVAMVSSAPNRVGLAPAVALAALQQGRVKGIDPRWATLFATYKGPFPLGSPVTLSNGALAVVVGQSDAPDGKARPIVAAVGSDGSLGEPKDLAGFPTIQISATPSPTEAGFNLALT